MGITYVLGYHENLSKTLRLNVEKATSHFVEKKKTSLLKYAVNPKRWGQVPKNCAQILDKASATDEFRMAIIVNRQEK